MKDQRLWSWHVAAGILVLLILGLHMVVMHLDEIFRIAALNPAGGEPVDWANVLARGKMIFFPVTYVLLLGAALFHGLYGLRNILRELNPKAGLRSFLSFVLITAGVVLFVLGTWSALASFTLARSL